MKIINDSKNGLLKRRELKVIVQADSNPGFEGARKMVSEELKVKDDVTVIKAVKSKFGRDTFLIDSFIYDSAKDRDFIEPKKKVKKGEAAGDKK